MKENTKGNNRIYDIEIYISMYMDSLNPLPKLRQQIIVSNLKMPVNNII